MKKQMKYFQDKIEGNKKIHAIDNKLVYSDKYLDGEYGISLTLIGYDENGDLVGVSNQDWEIIKITKDLKVQELGRIDQTLHDVRKHPELLLDDVKEMSLRDIEMALGHKVLIKDFKR